MFGKASKSSWKQFEQYFKFIGDSLGKNTQRVLKTFSVTLTEQKTHFGICPNKSGDLTLIRMAGDIYDFRNFEEIQLKIA